MDEEPVFTTLSCGCEHSAIAGLKQSASCEHGEDKHQELIKEAAKKASKK